MKKKFYLAALFILQSVFSNAQISALPYSEGFETPFTQGNNVEFVQHFNGNVVGSTNRIFQDAANHNSGAASCAVTPTSSFDGIIMIDLDLSAYSNVSISFYAATAMNGTGNRPAIVEISTSADGGYTYSPSTIIGDTIAFANANTSWNLYQFSLPYYTNLNPNVILKLKVSRGDGSGTTARWLFDDVTISASANDVTPPTIYDAYATSPTEIKVAYSEPVNSTANNLANYSGVTGISSSSNSTYNDTITLSLSTPLTEGQWYTLSVSGIQDGSSNTMSGVSNFTIAFNNDVGNIKFTEINYDNPGNDSLAFVELKNMESVPVNVGGWKFSKGLSGFLPSGLVLQPEEYIVLAQFPTAVNSFFGITAYQILGSLSNNGETVKIENSESVTIDSVNYGIDAPWDTLPNGYGPSLTLCDESSDNDLPSNWTPSTYFAGMFLGTDSIFATPMNNCQMTAGINEANASVFILYPNPANDIIHIKLEKPIENDMKVEVFDVMGRKQNVFSKNDHIGSMTIDLSIDNLSKGVFFVKLGNRSQQFIK